MLSLIEVKCPHCGTEGQINLPPLGAIIVGPCPECQEMVVIYCGKVLPLDKQIMKHGESGERRGHLKEVLRTYLEERVDRLFDNLERNGKLGANVGDNDLEATITNENEIANGTSGDEVHITQEEFDKFKRFELRLLDDVEYFRSVFE